MMILKVNTSRKCGLLYKRLQYAKGIDNNFIIIHQNGQELVTIDGAGDSEPSIEYLNAIDGVGREGLFYGYDNDNKATLSADSEYIIAFLDICKKMGLKF